MNALSKTVLALAVSGLFAAPLLAEEKAAPRDGEMKRPVSAAGADAKPSEKKADAPVPTTEAKGDWQAQLWERLRNGN